MEVHPGLGRFATTELGRGIAGRGSQRPGAITAAHQAEVEQHRQPVAVPPQQVRRTQVAMEQVLAVEGRQHRQQLTQQQQHLAGSEHQLALPAGVEQLGVGAAGLPVAHQPQAIPFADGRTDPRHLGMEHPLEACPEIARPGLIPLGRDAAQGNGGFPSEQVACEPERALLLRFAQPPLQAVAAANHLAGFCHRRGAHLSPAPHDRAGSARGPPASRGHTDGSGSGHRRRRARSRCGDRDPAGGRSPPPPPR